MNPYQVLLKGSWPPDRFVQNGLRLIESDFREQALRALDDWDRSGLDIRSDADAYASLYAAIASLQRPSWGHWNGLSMALRKARSVIRKAKVVEDMDRLAKAVHLNRLVEWIDTPLVPEAFVSLSALREMVQPNQKGKLNTAQAIGLAITLRNRIAHDSPEEPGWWAKAANAFRPLITYFSRTYDDFATKDGGWAAPWFLLKDGKPHAFNGLEKSRIPLFVSTTGVSVHSEESAPAVLEAFRRLLGQADVQEKDFHKLLTRLAPDELKGVMLGDYLVGPPTASGGFGTVHVGRQLSTGRKVAIKVLHDGLPDEHRWRFQQEAAYLARFDHPHIVRVLGQGEDTWTRPRNDYLAHEEWFKTWSRSAPVKSYMALEWIDGPTLDQAFRNAPVGSEIAADRLKAIAGWFLQAAGALAAVHGENMIHRDLKPGNLMLTADGRLKLMDFGIARTLDDARTLKTSKGDVLGTVAYMAPEQLRADAAGAEVGEAADLYSLCATFYELFTGSRIYDHATTDAALVVTRKLQGEMPEAPRRLRAGLPWEIETIVNGGLQAEPADRYKSATALAEDLRRFLADEPILYRKPSLGRRAKLFARRNRSLVKLSAAFAALAIVGLVVSFIALATERGRTESARAKIEGAEKESKESKADAEAKGKQAIQAKREKLREVYSADMTAALQAWKANKPQEVRALLAKYDPRKVTATEDLRGFEWYYLDRLIDGGFRTLDFGGASRVVRFSPDGGHLAVLGTILHPQSMPDNALKIWKLPEGTLESTWLMGRVTNVMSHPAHKLQASPVKDQGLAYSPDGKLVAATCTFIRENQRDGLVKIWEAATGHEVFSTTDTAIGGRAVVFSPDGKYILAGGYDNAVLVYEVATSKLRWTLPSFTRPMMRNGNGEETDAIPRALLKQGFMDTYHYPVVFLNFVRQNNANKLDRASERWTRIDWPPDEEGQGPSSYGREFFYAKTSGGPALVMTVHNSSSQDWGLITEASRTSLKLIDLKFIQGPNPATQEAALASATNLSLGGGTIQSVAFGRWSGFAMGGSDGLVMAGHINPNTRIWEQPQMMRGHSGDVTGLAFSDDSQQLAAVGTSQITVWKYGGDQNTRPIAAIAESSDPVRKSTRTTDRVLSDLAKGGQGRWVLRQQDSDDPRMLEVVDASRHDEVLKSFPLPVTRASFSAITDDGRICAFAEGIEIGITARGLPKKAKQTGPIRVVDLRESVVAARTLDDSEAPHRIIQFQPGTHRILVTTQKSLRLMDADTGLEILAYNNTGTLPTGGNFSSDGRWFVTQHQNKMIKLWAVDRPEAAQTFEVPRESIWTFRPDGKRLCFPGPSDSIRVWDLENNRLDREFSNSGREVNALCFDPEGSRLITTGGDSITFWSIDTGEDIFSLPVGGSARDKSRDLGRKIAELQKRWQAEWAARAP